MFKIIYDVYLGEFKFICTKCFKTQIFHAEEPYPVICEDCGVLLEPYVDRLQVSSTYRVRYHFNGLGGENQP